MPGYMYYKLLFSISASVTTYRLFRTFLTIYYFVKHNFQDLKTLKKIFKIMMHS